VGKESRNDEGRGGGKLLTWHHLHERGVEKLQATGVKRVKGAVSASKGDLRAQMNSTSGEMTPWGGQDWGVAINDSYRVAPEN